MHKKHKFISCCVKAKINVKQKNVKRYFGELKCRSSKNGLKIRQNVKYNSQNMHFKTKNPIFLKKPKIFFVIFVQPLDFKSNSLLFFLYGYI